MVTIRQADTDDIEVISVLIGEIEEYYGGQGDAGDPQQIREMLFGDRPAATVLLAVDERGVLGMASYSRLWPAARTGQSLYLKELYVREHARRDGVARALMNELTETARRLGCSRLEWTADLDNPPALEFYASLGAKERAGKVFYRAQID